MWRTHKNRVDQDLGGTYSSTGFHEGMSQDTHLILPNNFVNLEEVISGNVMDTHFDNPFLRWHKSFEDYPSFLNEMDDYALTKTDEYERLKRYKPDKKHTVGITPIVPREDSDEKFEFYDIQGESVYSNPPQPNTITVDHGMDEDHIWAFPKTLYNQIQDKNNWVHPFTKGAQYSYAPFWGEKLTQPHFYKKEKMEKFYRHWSHRLGLEVVKMHHAKKYGPTPSEQDRVQMKDDIAGYIDSCYDHEKLQKLRDVYVTDHKPQEPKYVTDSEAEDADFYDYQRSLEEYNNEIKPATVFG